MKSFVGYIANKIVKSLPRSKKVSPDIKSVKPTKLSVKDSIKKTKDDEHRKRYTALDKAEEKVKTGKKMMREGQKERKHMVDTKRAFQFRGGSRHAIEPGENPKVKYKGLIKEQKASGGRVGRKFGSPKPKTNIEKIKKTFAPKKKLSPKQMKIAKLAGNPNKIDGADFKKLRGRG